MKKLNNVLSIGQSKLIESIDGYITFNEYYRVWLDKIPLPTHYRLQDILLSPAFDSLFDESKALQSGYSKTQYYHHLKLAHEWLRGFFSACKKNLI